jgi:hypothetical protein
VPLCRPNQNVQVIAFCYPQLETGSGSHFDGCFKLLQGILPTCPHKRKSRENKTLPFSFAGLMTMKPTRTRPEKEKFFENGLDFLIFFAIYYYMMSNDAKLWQVKKELKL